MNELADVAIIGAGLAGLASATLLARRGFHVVVFEQDALPKHRVCGEYVSREALPFLTRLGFDPNTFDAKWIDRFELTTLGGQHFQTPLRSGGFGISRYRFDFALLELAQASGVHIEQRCAVHSLSEQADVYTLNTTHGPRTARLVLGCFGKRSAMDYALERPHAKTRSHYVAVKRHFRGDFPSALVSLNSIPGGYCGVSAVEGDLVNVCYLTTVPALNRHGGLRGYEAEGLRHNTRLAAQLDALTAVSEKPLVISQLNFETKSANHKHVLMLGDAAGLLHPLAGNGMAMALRSADLAAPRVEAFLRGKTTHPRLMLSYTHAWQNEVRMRRRIGRVLQRAFESDKLSDVLCRMARAFPNLARSVIENTHGRPF